MYIESLTLYPVKSITGVPVDMALAGPLGLEGDRRFLVAHPDGRQYTARTHPALLGVRAARDGEQWILRAAGAEPLRIGPTLAAPWSVQVWDERFDAVPVGAAADAWFSALLGEPARLAWLGATNARRAPRVEGGNAVAGMSFADGYPYLLASRASVNVLNRHTASPVELERFRPNLVVGGTRPWEEDTWARIRVGTLEFLLAGPCSRCVLTTRDPSTGRKSLDHEPLATLNRLRKGSSGDRSVYFGQNAVLAGSGGQIRVGDRVEVLETRPAPPFALGAGAE